MNDGNAAPIVTVGQGCAGATSGAIFACWRPKVYFGTHFLIVDSLLASGLQAEDSRPTPIDPITRNQRVENVLVLSPHQLQILRKIRCFSASEHPSDRYETDKASSCCRGVAVWR